MDTILKLNMQHTSNIPGQHKTVLPNCKRRQPFTAMTLLAVGCSSSHAGVVGKQATLATTTLHTNIATASQHSQCSRDTQRLHMKGLSNPSAH